MKKVALLQLFLAISVGAVAQTEDNEIIRMQKTRELATCEVVLYPNPSTDRVYITAPEGSSCTIYSAQGTYVGKWKVEDRGVELSDLGSGTYIALIERDGIQVRRNFVVL